MVEEHRQIGKPVQCAGLVSPRTLELAGYSGPRFQELRGASLHSPSGHTMSFRGNRAYAVSIDRSVFDGQLAERAQSAGAEFLTGFRVREMGYIPGGVELLASNKGEDSGAFRIRARLVIGADGANSTVASWLGLMPGERVRMAAAEVRLGSRSEACGEHAELFLGDEFAPGWFGWLFPIDQGIARVGIGVARSRQGHRRHGRTHARSGRGFPSIRGDDAHRRLKWLFARFPQYFGQCEVLKWTGGFVPIGPPRRIYADNVMLVGDAAAQVKPLSGGGLFLGLNAARLCAETAASALKNGDLSASALQDYQAKWNEFATEVASNLLLRRLFLSMSDRQMDFLVRFFNRPFWLNIVTTYGDIDYPSRLAGKIGELVGGRRSLIRLASRVGGAALGGYEFLSALLTARETDHDIGGPSDGFGRDAQWINEVAAGAQWINEVAAGDNMEVSRSGSGDPGTDLTAQGGTDHPGRN